MFLLNKKMKSRRNGTPALVSSLLIACTIQYAPGAWAEGHIVDIEGHVDCSDGHQSDACGWDGIPDINSMDSGSRGGGGGGGGTGSSNPPTPQKRTAEQKTKDQAICDKQNDTYLTNARLTYTQSTNVCAAKNSSWPGMLYQQWLEWALIQVKYVNGEITVGGVKLDCLSTANRAWEASQDGIEARYKICSNDAQRD